MNLIGHTEKFKSCLELLRANRLPHSVLITGDKGIGKFRFVNEFASKIAAMGENPSFSQRLLEQGVHPDIRIITPQEGKDIGVDEIREVASFVSLKPTIAPFRLLIIDSADDLNRSAANALLKILEEPPPSSLLMLISHRPGMLLDTIRSRCFKMKLSSLSYDEFKQVISAQGLSWGIDEMHKLYEMSSGSPGLAISLKEQEGLEFLNAVLGIVSGGRKAEVVDVAVKYSSDKCETSWSTVKFIISWVYGQILVASDKLQVASVNSNRRSVGEWLKLHDKTTSNLEQAESIDLNKKQALTLALYDLAA